MESSGRAVSKTVPGFEFRATFEGDIEGFRPVKVLVATTVLLQNVQATFTNSMQYAILWAEHGTYKAEWHLISPTLEGKISVPSQSFYSTLFLWKLDTLYPTDQQDLTYQQNLTDQKYLRMCHNLLSHLMSFGLVWER